MWLGETNSSKLILFLILLSFPQTTFAANEIDNEIKASVVEKTAVQGDDYFLDTIKRFILMIPQQ